MNNNTNTITGSITSVSEYLLSINDNLTDSATFYYQLFSANNIQLTDGNLTMTGSDYTTYSSSATSNDFAYSWGAAQLKLTLV